MWTVPKWGLGLENLCYEFTSVPCTDGRGRVTSVETRGLDAQRLRPQMHKSLNVEPVTVHSPCPAYGSRDR